MAKSTMNKVSKKVAKMDKSTLAIILVSLALVIVVTVILVRKSKREGFALMDLSNASFVTQGEDGAQGADGAQGVDGANGADGNDYIPSDQDRNNIYSDFKEKDLAENSRLQTELYNSFKNKLMGEMVQNKLLVKEDDKYFPVGVIGMKTIIFSDRLNNPYRYNRKDLKEGRAFAVKYNKQSTNSYVKVNYRLSVTGNNLHQGCTLKIYAKGTGNNKGTLISATGGAGVGEIDHSWDEKAPMSIDITGIDYTPQAEQRQYYLKIRLTNNDISINKVVHTDWQGSSINDMGVLRSSVTVEEIVLPDFNKDNIESLEIRDLISDID